MDNFVNNDENNDDNDNNVDVVPVQKNLIKLKKTTADQLWKSVEQLRTAYEQQYSNLNEEERRVLNVWRTELIPYWPMKAGIVSVRQLWFNGVPPQYRCVVWRFAVSNQLSLTKEQYARKFF